VASSAWLIGGPSRHKHPVGHGAYDMAAL